MKCHICSHPIVVSRLKSVRLDNNREVFYDLVFDICDYCNGPIIGVKKYERQDPNKSIDADLSEISASEIELYSKNDKENPYS